MTDYPPIQIVDADDKPVGSADMWEAYRQGLIFRVVYIMVEDSAGRILLQKRGPNVATFPNCWDVSVAGHVDEGESYEESARREVREELGIVDFDLQTIATFFNDTPVDGNPLKRFCRLFKVAVPVRSKISIDTTETAKVRWFTPAELLEFVSSHPSEIAGGLQDTLKRYLQP